jgi:hypothetical protein
MLALDPMACESRVMGKPSAGAFFSNWRESELPFREKVKTAIKNNLTKLRTGSACCGNHGEPGC